MSKMWKDHKSGGVWEIFGMQKVALQMQEQKENSLKKIQAIATVHKF